MSRREMLRVGSVGLISQLTLPRLLQYQALAGTDKTCKAKSCIFLFLEGGPSTIDMWDMKPDAPVEVRGPFKQIATNVPGTFICEHLPNCAKIANKYTILRSHSHQDNGHTTGYHYVMTGMKADFADGTNSRKPNNVLYPSVGSVISRELGGRGSVPPYINMPHPMTAGGAGFYGAEHSPFVIEGDPVQPDFEVRDLIAVEGIDAQREHRREQLLKGIESQRASTGKAGTMATYYEKARDLMNSPAARKAFEIKDEPAKLRETYGHTTLGQCALLARRLVEAGCRFVGIDHSGWDTHFTCFPSLQKDLIPSVDRAFSALVTDLDQRGLLDSTLVVMMGEMGRTPKVNAQAGRDHWSAAQSVLFAGGGIKPGMIIGATDKNATAPVADPVSVEDILRTIFHQMGVDSSKVYYTPLGRPVPIVNGGRVITDLVG
ncbi:DUF1501 domain-containing protein [Telmatocola sphagniphila]|uniref:DUF1501 domain-containing protein n=1 Tax=Telmatocola sphagniphila TaxID=1123043 RepID=A0A8E6EUM3_9BACT|nr:DUF1501 domain-containing protein [Telmatocola sphagniphila]QVL31600.1 DUF1501 domain-containing protein [Telmatocola sphagniphila]